MNVSVRHSQGEVSHQPHQQQMYLEQIKVPTGLVNLHSLLRVVCVCVCVCVCVHLSVWQCNDTGNWRLSHLHSDRDLSCSGCDFDGEFSYCLKQHNNKQVCCW